MQLPTELVPTTTERRCLDDGVEVLFSKTTPRFKPWRGTTPRNTFGRKPVLEYSGCPCFAELIIVRLFVAAGWSARWVVTYGAPAMQPRLLLDWSPGGIKAQLNEPITDAQTVATLTSVALANDQMYWGCWDVVAWHGPTIVFAEAKRRGHDRLRHTQLRWVSSALKCGIPASSFLLVEWSVA